MISPARPRTDHVDPATLMRIKSLEWRAKTVVEGFQAGLHRSPYHGFSAEFTEYRQYTAGDDLRYLDWKLFARSDRYYVKRFEDETNLCCHLVVDASRSMTYGSIGYSKYEYARTLAATFAHFLARQRDAVGLLRFDEDVTGFVPARFRPGQLRAILAELERPLTGSTTDLVTPLERVAETVRRRGLMVLVSDLLTPLDEFASKLGRLRARRHEVVVFRILDPSEIDFDFDRASLFEDLETGRRIHVDPAALKAEYSARFAAHQAEVQRACDSHGVTLRTVRTDEPLETALAEFLHARATTAGPSRRGGGTRRGVVA